MTPLMIHDETASGTLLNQVCLLLEGPSITVEELLRKRIEEEVESYSREYPERDGGGVFQLQAAGSHIALRSFRDRGFVIYINNRRVDDLKQEVEVSPNTSVRFVEC